MKRKIIVFVLLATMVFTLLACGKSDLRPYEEGSRNESESSSSQVDDYTGLTTTDATESITESEPASESELIDMNGEYIKKFPEVKPEWTTRIVYENGSTIKLTDEDIATFQYYAEAYTAIWCNNAAPDYDTSELPFLRTKSVEEIIASNDSRGDSTVVNSCQLLTVFVNPDDSVELIILSEIEGYLAKFDSRDVYSNLACVTISKDEAGWYIFKTGVLQVDPKGIWDVEFDEGQQKIVVVLIED